VNKVIPTILASNGRARRGVEGSELFVDPESLGRVRVEKKEGDVDEKYVKRKGQGKRKVKGREDEAVTESRLTQSGKKGARRRKDSLDEGLGFADLSINNTVPPKEGELQKPKKRGIRVITTDSLTAAHMLSFPSLYPIRNHTEQNLPTKRSKEPNVCILNMASPLRPGGGVLSGATSQEEFLCARTTLLPSLKDAFYRLPEVGGVYTSDVLVFRDSSPLSSTTGELGPGERYFVDVVSAGMLRFPDLEGEEEEEKRLGKKDRELVEAKMRGVLRILDRKGVKKTVLGAWGCGAYGNPVRDIAQAWRCVLDGNGAGSARKGKRGEESERWEQLEEVVFAISNRKMAEDFAKEFGFEVEMGSGGKVDQEDDVEEDDAAGQELSAKIKEMEGQIAQVWNPDLKARLGVILDGLRAQLAETKVVSDNGGDSAEDAVSNGEKETDDDEEEGSESEKQTDDEGHFAASALH
jgi:uncharacterized protein (TIGR02452 family)